MIKLRAPPGRAGAEGEGKMNNTRIVRFIEIGAYGERSGRQLLITADASRSAAADSAEWHIDPAFG
jgi:hypothetical protein